MADSETRHERNERKVGSSDDDHSSNCEDDEVGQPNPGDDQVVDDAMAAQRRRRRLALNRASARERRRRAKAARRDQGARIQQITQQCDLLQQQNVALQLSVTRLSAELNEARAIIQLLRAGVATAAGAVIQAHASAGRPMDPSQAYVGASMAQNTLTGIPLSVSAMAGNPAPQLAHQSREQVMLGLLAREITSHGPAVHTGAPAGLGYDRPEEQVSSAVASLWAGTGGNASSRVPLPALEFAAARHHHLLVRD